MVTTGHIKSIFVSNVKEDSTTKQVPYFIIHTYTIEDMVFGNVSILCTLAWMFYIREISLEVVVPFPRCYRFIRTVMEKISSSSLSSSTKLDGKVEGDEFYIKAGLKGRSYHDEIVKAGRKPRRRRLKPRRGRGTFYKDHPMITCIHQRRNGLTYFDVPVHQSLLEIVCSRVKYGSTVFTDEYIEHMTSLRNMASYTKV